MNEMTLESSRVPSVLKAAITESSLVPRLLKADPVICRVFASPQDTESGKH